MREKELFQSDKGKSHLGKHDFTGANQRIQRTVPATNKMTSGQGVTKSPFVKSLISYEVWLTSKADWGIYEFGFLSRESHSFVYCSLAITNSIRKKKGGKAQQTMLQFTAYWNTHHEEQIASMPFVDECWMSKKWPAARASGTLVSPKWIAHMNASCDKWHCKQSILIRHWLLRRRQTLRFAIGHQPPIRSSWLKPK